MPAPEPVHVELPPAADHLLLTVVLGAGIDGRAGRGRLELQDDAGQALWRSPFFALKPGTDDQRRPCPAVASRQRATAWRFCRRGQARRPSSCAAS